MAQTCNRWDLKRCESPSSLPSRSHRVWWYSSRQVVVVADIRKDTKGAALWHSVYGRAMGKKDASRKAARRAVADVTPRSAPSHVLSRHPNLVSTVAFICIMGGLALAKYELRRHLYSKSSMGASEETIDLVPSPRGGACGKYEPNVPGCSPRGSSCGHLVVNDFASAAEVDALRSIAARGMALGGGAGGPTILDLQSGALSYGDKVRMAAATAWQPTSSLSLSPPPCLSHHCVLSPRPSVCGRLDGLQRHGRRAGLPAE